MSSKKKDDVSLSVLHDDTQYSDAMWTQEFLYDDCADDIQQPDQLESESSNDLLFSVEELQLFTKRYENGYDLRNDDRYNIWLHVTHPSSQGEF